MGPAPVEAPGLPPKRKVKAYKVLGDVGEFRERLAATLPPPKTPPPPDVFSIQDAGEFPPEVWFAATISPDNGVAIIASYRELCKARSLYQQQLTNIHTARKQHGMVTATAAGALGPLTTAGLGPVVGPAGEPPLASRTITETVRLGAETRVLGKFEMQQAKWDGVTAALATRVGRQPQELAMQRGPAWRTRAELTELLYRAQPRDARGLNPDEAFLTSLRDCWERVIPLGNIFSGLALHLKDKPHELPATRAARVGRPLDSLPRGPPRTLKQLGALSGRTAAAGTTTTATSQQLLPPNQTLPPMAAQTYNPSQPQPPEADGGTRTALLPAPAGRTLQGGRPGGPGGPPPLVRSLSARGRGWEDSEVLRQRVAEYGRRLTALAPHDPDFGSLVVAGEALEGQLEALAGAPVSLAEVEAHVREHDPGAYDGYKAVKDEMEAQLRAALEAEATAREAAEAAARALAPQPGPSLALSAPLLSLGCHVGERAHGRLVLRSGGTAAVWWRWERRAGPQPEHSATELGTPGRFVASQQSGVLLPGQSLELAVTFEAGAAGTFRETWELVTTPPLQGPSPRLTLLLRGAAELRDQTAIGRSGFESRLAHREKMARVAAALERVLRDVRPLRRAPVSEPPEEAAAADSWDKANGCSAGDGGGPYAWPPLFYSPSVQSELTEVYREANAALTVALTPPPEEDPKKKRKDVPSPRHRKTVEEAPPPPPRFPLEWEGPSLATLDSLLAQLAAAAPAVAAPLAARAAAAKARARVPPSGRRLLRRAMRCLVGKMVDAVAEKMDGVRADLEAKAAAEAAAAAAAAAAAGGGDGSAAADGLDGEQSSAVVAHGKGGAAASGGGKGGAGGKDKEKGGKDKGGKDKGKDKAGAAHGAAAGDADADAAGGAGALAAAAFTLEQLQPAFHDKAVTGARSVVKASLNGLQEEVLRHKVAVGDALEARLRAIDDRIDRHLAAAPAPAAPAAPADAALAGGEEGDGQAAAEAAAAAAAAAGGAVEWFAPPAGGVPAPRPAAAAPVRSPALEQLYWERLCELRIWTSLGIPNRGDIR